MNILEQILVGVVTAAIGAGVAGYVKVSSQMARLENEAEHTRSDLALLKLELKELRSAMASATNRVSPPAPDNKSFAANIANPAPNSNVGETFLVEGTTSEPVPKDHHLWLFIRRGELSWAKDPEIFVVNNSWKKEVSEGAGHFSIVLSLLKKAEHEQIQEWLKKGADTKHFRGFSSVPGAPVAIVDIARR